MPDKNYPEGERYKTRLNYPSGGWCEHRSDCKGKCKGCIKINGKYTGFRAK